MHQRNRLKREANQSILEIDNTRKIIILSGDSSIKETALPVGEISFKEKSFNLSELDQQIHILKKARKNSY